MRSFTVAIMLAALAFVQPAHADDSCVTPKQIVESYLRDRHPTSKRLRVAVYDATTHEWQAFLWDGQEATRTPSAIETPVSNEPTLFVRRGEEVEVLVLHANPLLYSGEVTKVERADIEGLAELQKLATLLGATLPNLLHPERLGRTVSPNTAQELNAKASQLNVHSFPPENKAWKMPLEPDVAEKVIENRRDTLMPLVDAFITALDHEYGPIRQDVNDAIKKVEAAKNRGLALDAARLRVADSLQFAELGTPAVVPRGERELFLQAPATVRKEYDSASNAAAVLRPMAPLCGDSLAALDSALSVLLDTAPADDDEKEADEKSVRASLAKLRKSSITADCVRPADPEPQAVDRAPQALELSNALLALADWLRKPDNRATAVDEEIARLLDSVRAAVASYRRAFDSRKTVLEQAATVAEKRGATLKLAVQLQRFAELYAKQVVDETHCWYTQGVVEVERTQKNALDLPRFEVQTEEFHVTVRTAFKDDVLRTLPDEMSGKYTLSHGNYGLGVDTALVFTHANDREYAAVEEKVKDLNNDGMVDDKDKQIVIHEKSRTERTGKLALMLTFAPPKLHGLGAQFGLGVDSDNPSVFIGATWSIGKFARLSAGHTQQRVTRLVGSQSVGAVLPAADALSTRERFDASWYAALAFTISKLSIFSTK